MCDQKIFLTGKPGFIKPLKAVVDEESKTCALSLTIFAALNICPERGQLATLTYGKRRRKVWVTDGASTWTTQYRSVCTGTPLRLHKGQEVRLIPFSLTTLLKRGRRVLDRMEPKKSIVADLWELLTILHSLWPYEEQESVVKFDEKVAQALSIKQPGSHEAMMSKVHTLYTKKKR